jgi:hypothetical protein
LGGRVEPIELASAWILITGLPSDDDYYVSLGLALEPGGSVELMGPVLSARTGAPIYADPAASGIGADGLTPETAFPNLFGAVFTASFAGGGNVFVAEGTFTDVSVPLLTGVHLYGGFAPGFDLAERDPVAHETVLTGLPNLNVLTLEVGGDLQRVDGLTLDGVGEAATGIDVDRTPSQLTSLLIRGASRGIRIRASDFVSPTPVLAVDVVCRENDLEGLSLVGPYDMTLEACGFFNNGQEGVECGPWVAPVATTVSINIRDCDFSGNGFEGLDVDLAAPGGLGAPGTFVLDIEDCDFEQNAAAGCLVDLDYELAPGWSASFRLRGCLSRGNAGAGYALDLDGSFDGALHRLAATSNVGDGLSVTSESYAGHLVVSASSFVANQGAGVRSSLGNVGLALSHCLVSGNVDGGVRAQSAPATAISSASHLQATPFSQVGLRGTPVLPATPLPFQYAPIEFRRVLGLTADGVTLDSAIQSDTSLAVELSADEVVRTVVTSAGAEVTLSVPPTSAFLPASLAIFPGASSVAEDYTPRADSALIGAGVSTPLGAPVDAGPLGGPLPGQPGIEDLSPTSLFYAGRTEPAWGRAIGTSQDFRIELVGGVPDGASLPGGVQLIDGAGVAWPLSATLVGGAIVVSPPAGGWAAGDRVELHGSLISESGTPCLPVSIPVGPFQP